MHLITGWQEPKTNCCPTVGRWSQAHYVTFTHNLEVRITKRRKACSLHLNVSFLFFFAGMFACAHANFSTQRKTWMQRLKQHKLTLLNRTEALHSTVEIYLQITVAPNRGNQQAVKIKMTLKLHGKTYNQNWLLDGAVARRAQQDQTLQHRRQEEAHFIHTWGKWGSGGKNQELGKTIKQVTHGGRVWPATRGELHFKIKQEVLGQNFTPVWHKGTVLAVWP